MFVVFATQGKRKVAGQPCFVWRGIPSFTQLMEDIGESAVQGMRIEVSDLGLPDRCVNTYVKSGTSGSYDGRTLTVGHSLRGCDTRNLDTRRPTLELVYKKVCRLYFDIFHGRAEGDHRIAPDTPPLADGTKPKE